MSVNTTSRQVSDFEIIKKACEIGFIKNMYQSSIDSMADVISDCFPDETKERIVACVFKAIEISGFEKTNYPIDNTKRPRWLD